MKGARTSAWLLGIAGLLTGIVLFVQLPQGPAAVIAMFMAGASLVLILPACRKLRTQRARATLVWAFFCYAFLMAALAADVWFLGRHSSAVLPAALSLAGFAGSGWAFRTRRAGRRDYIKSYFTD